MTTPEKPLTKTAYVLSLPSDLSAKEVAARAKAAGITISDKHVAVIRSIARRKSGGKRKSGNTAATPKTKRSSAPAKQQQRAKSTKPATRAGQPSKSEFVRSQPSDLAAAEVVAAARKAGLSITPRYVHEVRYAARHSKKAKRGAPTKTSAIKPEQAKRAQPAHGGGERSLEDQFKWLVLELGVARARAILNAVETVLSAAMSEL